MDDNDWLSMTSLDINAAGSLASISGLGGSLAAWIIQYISKSKRDIKKQTIDEYLEWLRRKNHFELHSQIKQSKNTLESIQNTLEKINKLIFETSDTNVFQQKKIDQKETILGSFLKIQDLDKSKIIENKAVKHAINLIIDQLLNLEIKVDPVFLGDSISLERKDYKEDRFKQFEKEFLSHVRKQYGYISFAGMREEYGNIKQKLDIAYQSINLLDNNDMGSIRADKILSDYKYLTIRACAGAGKSTLLHWIALQCSKVDEPDNNWEGFIPFYIPLRTVANDSNGRPPINKFIEYSIGASLFAEEIPDNWLSTVLKSNRAVILLDGVDELPLNLRRNFWVWLSSFIIHYPLVRVIVTSRYFPASYTDNHMLFWDPPESFAHSELDFMRGSDIDKFIFKWHEALAEEEKQNVWQRAEIYAMRDELLQMLSDSANSRIRELCNSPLLCSLICAVNWRTEGDFPSERIDLYDKCCTLLIGSRDQRRNIAVPMDEMSFLSWRDKEMILQRLALNMMRNANRKNSNVLLEVSREDAAIWIKESIQLCKKKHARDLNVEEIIDYLIERTGLIQETKGNIVYFQHRTFQEYLAACAAGIQSQARDLANRAGDDLWHDTIILSAGTRTGGAKFGHDLIQSLIDIGESDYYRSRVCFALAVACLETAEQLDPILREKVENHISKVVPPTDNNEARMLSSGGDKVLKYLEYAIVKNEITRYVAASARTISLIGSKRSIQMLTDINGYAGERRVPVISEVLMCPQINPFSIPVIQKSLVSTKETKLPVSIAAYLAKATDLSPIINLSEARQLSLTACESISNLNPLQSLKKLQILSLRGCKEVDNITVLKELVELSSLNLSNCPKISELDPILKLRKLRFLYLDGCDAIDNLSPLLNVNSLTNIVADKRLKKTTPEKLLSKIRFV
jgi:NACHT domain